MTANSAYARAGVDIDAGNLATQLIKTAVRSTFGPEVLSDVGSFGGLYRLVAAQPMTDPVLVASTDGVGTKTQVAARLGRWDTIGYDIVNHCINDILAQGARPLFFLDYVASCQIEPQQIAAIVGGIAAACRAAGCALLGGETAEMPGVYAAGAVDLVGTIVGIVERAAIIDGRRIQPGDAILGLPSSGLHTNGYTLARHILDGLDWSQPAPGMTEPLGDLLLAPHRSYLAQIQALQAAGIDIRGLAHITGGGLIDNPPRIFPPGIGARLWRGSWPEPPIFGLIQSLGNVSDAEMCRVFNMGLGMLAALPANELPAAQSLLDESYLVGEIITDNSQQVAVNR
ncbi:MAG: phosphoribosylformylglycinamidine cyclo-ligase [Candidatus Promineifilaceae bacterium]